MVAYNCHPRDSGNLNRGISLSRLAWAKIVISKITTTKRIGDIVHLVECLPSKCEVLSFRTSPQWRKPASGLHPSEEKQIPSKQSWVWWHISWSQLFRRQRIRAGLRKWWDHSEKQMKYKDQESGLSCRSFEFNPQYNQKEKQYINKNLRPLNRQSTLSIEQEAKILSVDNKG
jgi:hypothetical protein